MIRQDQVIGVMTLERCDRPARFERWQIDLAATIAGPPAPSLEKTRLYTHGRGRPRRARGAPPPWGADRAAPSSADASRQQLVPLGGYHVPKDLLALLMS